ncbi:hypothetical protein LTR75_002510 [Friedmanniomyces endolithicus]|nr:hypothetical protein LTR75_002510 [Friedmanniomyces endolithicus]
MAAFSLYTASLVAAAFSTLALAVPTPASLGSDLQILLHNDLYGNASARGDVVIVLGTPQTQQAAASDCSALGESLWTPPSDLNADNFLAYLAYQSGQQSGSGHWWPSRGGRGYPPSYPFGPSHGEVYFIADSGSNGACKVITTSAQTFDMNCDARLPALCTNTAPLSGINYTDTSSRVQTQVASGNAMYTGFRDKVSFRFLGIQYGTYPQRFTYSSALEPTGEVSALEFGAICRQIDGLTNVNDGSEDCLHLNIYSPYLPSPKTAKPMLKPVLFWIHGGAYINGYGSDPTWDGGNLASRGDIVVVTINYRLGDFGFLVGPNGTGLNGNYGISDQVSALQWVKANIAAFGGDPNHVTIGGQSAGAGSVRALLQSPPAAGLFAGAILESDPSPPSYSYYLSLDQEYAAQTLPILNLTGCGSSNSNAEVACLRNYNASALVGLAAVANNVVVDGTYVVTPAITFNGTGHVNKVPLLMGTMRDEGGSLDTVVQTTNLSLSLAKNLLPVAPVVDNPSVFPLPGSGNVTLDIYNVTTRVSTDASFYCLDVATAYAVAKTHTLPEMYYYQFNRSYQIPYWPPPPNKALCNAPPDAAHPGGNPDAEYFKCHSGDLTTIFGTWRRWGLPERDENDTPFTQFIIDSWSSWVRTWNPNPDPALLKVRGYANTTREMALAGSLWAQVDASAPTLRRLQWPSSQQPFPEAAQCSALGLPLDYFFLPGV